MRRDLLCCRTVYEFEQFRCKTDFVIVTLHSDGADGFLRHGLPRIQGNRCLFFPTAGRRVREGEKSGSARLSREPEIQRFAGGVTVWAHLRVFFKIEVRLRKSRREERVESEPSFFAHSTVRTLKLSVPPRAFRKTFRQRFFLEVEESPTLRVAPGVSASAAVGLSFLKFWGRRDGFGRRIDGLTCLTQTPAATGGTRSASAAPCVAFDDRPDPPGEGGGTCSVTARGPYVMLSGKTGRRNQFF